MPHYLIERAVGDVNRAQLDEVVERATRIIHEIEADLAPAGG